MHFLQFLPEVTPFWIFFYVGWLPAIVEFTCIARKKRIIILRRLLRIRQPSDEGWKKAKGNPPNRRGLRSLSFIDFSRWVHSEIISKTLLDRHALKWIECLILG